MAIAQILLQPKSTTVLPPFASAKIGR